MKLPFRLIASLFALMLVCSCGCLDLDFVTFVNPTVEPEKAKTQRALYVALLPLQHVSTLYFCMLHGEIFEQAVSDSCKPRMCRCA